MTAQSNINTICRLCLKYNNKSMVNIFVDSINKIRTYKMVEYLCNFPVKQDDSLPQTICSPCRKALKDVTSFINTCHRSYNILAKTNDDSTTFIKPIDFTEFYERKNWNLNKFKNMFKCDKRLTSVNEVSCNPAIRTKKTENQKIGTNSLPSNIIDLSENLITPESTLEMNVQTTNLNYDCNIEKKSSVSSKENPTISEVPECLPVVIQQSITENATATNVMPVIRMRTIPTNNLSFRKPSVAKRSSIQITPAKKQEIHEIINQSESMHPYSEFGSKQNRFRKILPKPSYYDILRRNNDLLSSATETPTFPSTSFTNITKEMPIKMNHLKRKYITIDENEYNYKKILNNVTEIDIANIKNEDEGDPLKLIGGKKKFDNTVLNSIIKEEVIIPDELSSAEEVESKRKKISKKEYLCQACQSGFVTKSAYINHMFQKHGSISNQVSKNNFLYKLKTLMVEEGIMDLNMEETIQSINIETPIQSQKKISKKISEVFECFFCKNTFKKKYFLMLHLNGKQYDKDKTWYCKYCPKIFPNKCLRNEHYKVCTYFRKVS